MALTQRWTGRVAAGLAAAAVAGLAVGCGGGSGGGGGVTSGPGQSAGDFIHQVTTQFSRGQSGRLWDSLHPADQAVVSRARYTACQSNEGFEIQKFTILETYADPVVIAGRSLPAQAVTVQVTSDDGVTTATMHAVKAAGGWRWTLPAKDLAAYARGACPSTA